MAPKNKVSKLPADKAGASKVAGVVVALADSDVAPALQEPDAARADGAVSPRGCEETPEGGIQEIPLDKNSNEIQEEEEEVDGEITEQARNLKTLSQYQQDILRLQGEKEQLLRQTATRNRSKQT